METPSVDPSLSFTSGATFTAPKGWHTTRSGGHWVLQDPERTVSMALMEVEEEDVVSAAREAWRVFRPGFARDLLEVLPLPDNDGWDQVFFLRYETVPSERRVVSVRARRKDDCWYVSLLDGEEAGVDRRRAQILLVSKSFRAPGIRPEDFGGKKAIVLDKTGWEDFSRFVEEARAAAGVPGTAVAVVQDGTVAFEGGFGVLEAGSSETVTPKTLFSTGSIGKQLTTLMMARLVERGVFGWETPVLRIEPRFKLDDEETTGRLTMRHTVSASTGLPRRDMEFFFRPSDTTPEDAMAGMAVMRPTTGFGEVFQYSNSMVAAGGYIAAYASHPHMTLGEAFDLAMNEEVFTPLGMHDTTLDLRSSFGTRVATPHALTLWGQVKPLALSMEIGMLRPERPAGGYWSDLRDMEKVLLMELSLGLAPGGGRYLSEAGLLERRQPQVRMDDRSSYALGLVVEEDCGVRVVSHSGSTNGFMGHLFFLPDHQVGAVIFTNLAADEASFFMEAVRRKLMEVLFEGRQKAALDIERDLKEKARQTMEEAAKVEPRPDGTWRESLVGTYRAPGLGEMRIHLTDEGAVLEASQWEGLLGRKLEKDGSVKAVVMTPPLTGLEFSLGEQAGHKALLLDLPQQSYVFERDETPSVGPT